MVAAPSPRLIRFGGLFEADLRSGELRRRGAKVDLQELPFRALALLLERAGTVVAREEIASALWPKSIHVDFDQGINTAIRKIRLALRDSAERPRFIETVGRRGYRFVAAIDVEPGTEGRETPQPAAAIRFTRPRVLPRAADLAPGSPPGLTPFVGREHERQVLLERFDRVRKGEGQAVLVTGEAGIGKSRLLRQLRADLASTPHAWIECRGSAHHQHTPFHPIVERLRGASPSGPERLDDLEWLESALSRAGIARSEALPLASMVLGLPPAERHPALLVSPEQARQRLMSTLGRWVAAAARVEPLVLVFEDLHWVDASTLAALRMLAEEGAEAPLLLLLTARPQFRTPWPLLAHHLQLALPRLNRPQVRQMIEFVAEGGELRETLVEAVIRRTDGVPLFVEELTRALMGPRGQARASREIPASLQASLLERIDRLGPAKEVAQAGAAIGREFSWPLLHAVAELPRDALQGALAQIARAELVYVHGSPPEATYEFVHTLVCDAAYASLSATRRRELHRRIARALRERFPLLAEAEPELVAHHHTEAGEVEAAVAAWRGAGERAAQRSALVEAIGHYGSALDLLQPLPDSPERRQQELPLRIAHGHALAATRGWGSAAAAESFARARELCEQLGDAQSIPVLVGLWDSSFTRGELRVAQELADQLLRVANRTRTSTTRAWAHVAQGMTRQFRGDFRAAFEHFERAIALYEEEDYRGAPVDPGVLALSIGPVSAWQVGHADRAQEWIGEALALTRRINREVAIGIAEIGACTLYALLREPTEVLAHANRALQLGSAQQLVAVSTPAHVLRAAALAELGRDEAGLAQLRERLGRLLMVGHRLGHALSTSFLVAACLHAGATDEGLALAHDLRGAGSEEEIALAELLRLRGELLAQSGADASEVESSYREAIAAARRQGSLAFELRAATSLAQLLATQERVGEAREVLAPLYASFSEGFDTRDLREARALLDQLG